MLPNSHLSGADWGERRVGELKALLDKAKYRLRTSEATRSEASAPAAKRRYLMAF